jgi:hypothetical protein
VLFACGGGVRVVLAIVLFGHCRHCFTKTVFSTAWLFSQPLLANHFLLTISCYNNFFPTSSSRLLLPDHCFFPTTGGARGTNRHHVCVSFFVPTTRQVFVRRHVLCRIEEIGQPPHQGLLFSFSHSEGFLSIFD